VSFLEAGSTGDESSYDDTIWVFEPSVNLCLNITQHFRAAVGVGYRKIIGLDSDTETTYGLTESQLDGYTIGLTLRFGSY